MPAAVPGHAWDMPTTMRAITQDTAGGPEVLHLTEAPVPEPIPTEIRVRVTAAGVNPVDTKVRAGGAGLGSAGGDMTTPPFTVGWDVAGVVEEAGPAVTWFKPGDKVYGYMRRHHLEYGTYAEYATAPEGFFAHKPPGLSFEEAAALPLPVLTAHQALERLGLRGGESLFVGGGAGGVGHLAIQLAVERGARVVATASERNHDFLRDTLAVITTSSPACFARFL